MNQRQTYTKHPVIARASAPPNSPYPWDDDDYDDRWTPPVPNSARCYQGYPVTTAGNPPVLYSGNRKYTLREAPPPVTHQQPRQTTQQPRPKRHAHPLLYLGLGMLGMVALWTIGMMVVGWWNLTQDDIHYGRPRTFQTDMVVGHSDSADHPSHFIAINVNHHVEVIEFPGGDARKAKIYLVSTLIGEQDLAVVTLSFKDVNGDGKLDMIVNVANTHFVFINDQGQFRPARPDENISM